MKPGDLVYLKEDPHAPWANEPIARKNLGLGTIMKMEPVGVEHPGVGYGAAALLHNSEDQDVENDQCVVCCRCALKLNFGSQREKKHTLPGNLSGERGFGRTGHHWGAQTFHMKPTTLTAAKGLSSAYIPISAVIVPEFLYEPMIESYIYICRPFEVAAVQSCH